MEGGELETQNDPEKKVIFRLENVYLDLLPLSSNQSTQNCFKLILDQTC